MTESLLSTNALEIGYSRGPLLAPIDLTIGKGQFWCVLGRNGAGKTTLVRTLLGLLSPLGGSCRLKQRLRLAYLPQTARFDPLYPMSARDIVLMGTDRGRSFLKPRAPQATQHAETAIKTLKLDQLAATRFRDLSEGQKQRVLLARLSASKPALAFLDEPTTAMDQMAERQAFEYMARLCLNEQTSMVVVTHDFSLAREYADHALFVDDARRRVISGPAEEVLASDALAQRFGKTKRGNQP